MQYFWEIVHKHCGSVPWTSYLLTLLLNDKIKISTVWSLQKVTSHSTWLWENIELIHTVVNRLDSCMFSSTSNCPSYHQDETSLYSFNLSASTIVCYRFSVLHWWGWITWVCTVLLIKLLANLCGHSHTLVVFALKNIAT